MVKLKLGRPNMVKLKCRSKNRPNMVKLSSISVLFSASLFFLHGQKSIINYLSPPSPAAPSLAVDCRRTGVARHCGPGRLEEEDATDEGEGTAAAVDVGGGGGGGGLSSRGLRGRSIMPPNSESEDLSNSPHYN